MSAFSRKNVEFDRLDASRPSGWAVGLRYGGARQPNRLRRWMMERFARSQGKTALFLSSHPEEVARVLKNSRVKGTFLESLIATPAWHPLISIESVDGPLWERLMELFRMVLPATQWKARLPSLAEAAWADVPGRALDSREKVTAEVVSRWSAHLFWSLLFDSKPDLDLLYAASIEWRKEIAVKGQGSVRVKETLVRAVVQAVEASEWMKIPVFKEAMLQRPMEVISVFAQPFLISPMINFSDIFAAMVPYLRADRALKWQEAVDLRDSRAALSSYLLETLRLQHPFPVLERELETPLVIFGELRPAKTQVFILLDEFEQDQEFMPERWGISGEQGNALHSAALPFGVGPRACPGRALATEVFLAFFERVLGRVRLEDFSPEVDHVFSGRDNDQETGLVESFYQVKTLARAYRVGKRHLR